MNKSCKNCAGRLIYDIQKNGLLCETCGTLFSVNDYENLSKDSESEVVFNKDDEFLDVNIYACSACGAEISVTDTEVSTFCIYCGNPTLLFSRIGKMRRPDSILPFTVTKEKALKLVTERLHQGCFIPKEIKNIQSEQLRSIYIPYYVSHVEYDSSILFCASQKDNPYRLRSAYASMPNVTTDASKVIDNELSQRIEPYPLEKLEDFNENYLVGHYADMPDMQIEDAKEIAKSQARDAYNRSIAESIEGAPKPVIVAERYRAEIYDPLKIVLLPAWFLTIRYQDQPYTLIVNGQTGKVVAGLPWDKKRFWLLMVALTLCFSIICFFISWGVLSIQERDLLGAFSGYITAFFLVAIGYIILSARKIRRIIASIRRTCANPLHEYVNNRQEGEA